VRICCTVLHDNAVYVHEASENTKYDVGLRMLVENVEETRRILHNIVMTVSTCILHGV